MTISKNKKKKNPIVNKDRFIESIYHIVLYGNNVRCFRDLLTSVAEKVNDQERRLIRYSIHSNIMIMTISLIDELNKYLFRHEPTDQDTKDKIQSYAYIIEPILTQISKWEDLRKFRNNVLAHNFRIDSDSFKSVHLNNKLKSYNIPESFIDLITLLKYLDSITKVAEEVFDLEYKSALTIMNEFGNSPRINKQTVEEEFQKTNSILSEVNQRISDYNKGIKKDSK